MSTEGLGPLMTPAVILLSAAVVAVPVFRRAGAWLGVWAISRRGWRWGRIGLGFFS
jgi:hypothetical protein